MAFAYYKKLSAGQKRIYDLSDKETFVKISGASEFHPLISELEKALAEEDRGRTEMLSRSLISGLAARLKMPPVKIRVLAVRPHNSRGELYGIYYPSDRGTPAAIAVWMRTAQQKRVVAFKTFLRTILHELCHHIDYEYFGFPYSFHTEGFYKRESSLFHQLTDKKI